MQIRKGLEALANAKAELLETWSNDLGLTQESLGNIQDPRISSVLKDIEHFFSKWLEGLLSKADSIPNPTQTLGNDRNWEGWLAQLKGRSAMSSTSKSPRNWFPILANGFSVS